MVSRRRLRASATAVLGALLLSCGGSDVDLFPLWVNTDVLVADIDGDGRNDVLSLVQLSTSQMERQGILTVRLQTSTGALAPAVSYVVGVYPWKMALGDIDGDGAPDLVVSDVGSNITGAAPAIWLLRQDSAKRGAFELPQGLAVNPRWPYDVAIGDLNGDSAPDVVVADSLTPGRGATVLYQDPADRGNFLVPTLIALPGDATHVAIGDLNGDGHDDLVFRVLVSRTDYVPDTLMAIVYQQPDGTLGSPATLSAQTGLNTKMLAVSDYNVDGARDVVEFFSRFGDPYQPKVTTLLQDPPGTFSPFDTSLATLQGRDGGVVADLNGDGRPDFAMVGFYPVGSPTTVYSTLNLLLQDGSGGFTPSAAIAMPVASSRLAAGDIDGDGRKDLVVLGGDNQLFLLRQSGASPGTFLPPAPL